MLSAIGRAAIRRLGAQPANQLVQSFQYVSRVTTLKNCTVPLRYAQYTTSAARLYAPAAASKTKKSTKTSTKSKAARSKKSGTKTTKKPAKKKTTTKKTAKKTTKAKKPVRKQLTEKQKEEKEAKKERQHIRDLRETALLPSPHKLPDTAWAILLSEYMKANAEKGQAITSKAKEAAEKYKSLSPEELEQLNHRANQNKATNASAHKKWVESHTPDQIRLANNARRLLAKKTGKKHPTIPDERAPKKPRNAYFLFTADRWATGDLKGIPVTKSTTRLLEEWANLSANEKKVYEDRAVADKERYLREAQAVYH